jgi:hypothetical protein
VVAVRVMKMTVDQVIDMIPMRYCFVSATWAVDVTLFVAAAVWRTLVRVFCADLDLVFVNMIAMRMVQMAIMQIVDVATMFDRGVSAARAMLMVVVSVMSFVARAHAYLPCSIGRAGTSSGHRPRSGLKTSVRAMVRPMQTCLGLRSISIARAATGAKPARRAAESMRNEAETSSPLRVRILPVASNHTKRT